MNLRDIAASLRRLSRCHASGGFGNGTQGAAGEGLHMTKVPASNFNARAIKRNGEWVETGDDASKF